MNWLIVVDVLLAVGFAARLTRAVTVDDVGLWLVRGPAERVVQETAAPLWVKRALSGVDCPYCVGFWLGVLVLAALWVAGGPGAAGGLVELWRWVAAAFTLNVFVGWLVSR